MRHQVAARRAADAGRASSSTSTRCGTTARRARAPTLDLWHWELRSDEIDAIRAMFRAVGKREARAKDEVTVAPRKLYHVCRNVRAIF